MVKLNVTWTEIYGRIGLREQKVALLFTNSLTEYNWKNNLASTTLNLGLFQKLVGDSHILALLLEYLYIQ